MVTRKVCSRGESNVLSDAHMGEPNEFCQKRTTSGKGSLNFVEFLAEILDE
jgi:hypothetical protein